MPGRFHHENLYRGQALLQRLFLSCVKHDRVQGVELLLLLDKRTEGYDFSDSHF